ncbi:helix-turn-helix domain-containing protein [Virgibacillus ndiopensis]|uniref:helix-turn-helix domain-containing protein n=1 Tax=Virgibacillus ndiopensis TaxID=2004408 RepID=UPI000C08761F|nr:helix-turn-helix domain-containing protein [Virgibacillus ndiopensis]
MLFDGILLKCCSNIKNERSLAAIYHLLQGKKSIQTVQDAHSYALKNFYGIYRSITKQLIDKQIRQLIKQNLLTDDFIPTTNGENWLLHNEYILLLDMFNGIKYHTIAPVFSDRLLLLIQTLTNSKKNYFSFIPIIDKTSVLYWMKLYYRKIKSNETAYLNAIYVELQQLLSTFSNEEANLFVDRLSGYKMYGKSSHQLSESHNLNLPDLHLVWVRMVHRILSAVYSDFMRYPILHSIISDIENKILITSSAQRTVNLLHEKYTVEDIAQIRKLKINTIYDHIVEIALFDSAFPIAQYVSKEQQGEIIKAIERTNSSSLKTIKEIVNSEISYFQIRLVLANVNKYKQLR